VNHSDSYQIHLAVKELDEEGYDCREIRKRLSGKWTLTYRQVWYYKKQRLPSSRVAKNYKTPSMTSKGMVWAKFPQGERMSCEMCEMLKKCNEAVKTGNFIACEVPLEKELL